MSVRNENEKRGETEGSERSRDGRTELRRQFMRLKKLVKGKERKTCIK